MLKDSEAGARHLSSNAYVHHYFEGPAERLDSKYANYEAERDSGSAKQLQMWINGLSKAKDSKLGQIFNHAETREYIEILREFRPHFNVNAYFSQKFCGGKLHNVNGAVSEKGDEGR
jgi:hypothetical protein